MAHRCLMGGLVTLTVTAVMLVVGACGNSATPTEVPLEEPAETVEVPITEPTEVPVNSEAGRIPTYEDWEAQHNEPEVVDGLYGVVGDENGDPVWEARVRVYVPTDEGWGLVPELETSTNEEGVWRFDQIAPDGETQYRVEAISPYGELSVFYPVAATVEEAVSVVVARATSYQPAGGDGRAVPVAFGGTGGREASSGLPARNVGQTGKYGMAIVLQELCDSPVTVDVDVNGESESLDPDPAARCATNTCLDSDLALTATVRISFTVPCEKSPSVKPVLVIGQGTKQIRLAAVVTPATYPGEYVWELEYKDLKSGTPFIEWVCLSGKLPSRQRVARFVVCDPTGRITDGAGAGVVGTARLYYVQNRTPSSSVGVDQNTGDTDDQTECISTSNSVITGATPMQQWNKYHEVLPKCDLPGLNPTLVSTSSLNTPRTDINPVSLISSGPQQGRYEFTGVTRGYCYCVRIEPSGFGIQQLWSPLIGFGNGDPLITDLDYQY